MSKINNFIKKLISAPEQIDVSTQRQIDWNNLDAMNLSIFSMIKRSFKLGINGNAGLVFISAISLLVAASANALFPIAIRNLALLIDNNYDSFRGISDYLPLVVFPANGEPIGLQYYYWCIGLVASIMLVRWFFESLGGVGFFFFGRKITEKIQIQVTEKLLSADIDWLNNMHSGRLAQLAVGDVDAIKDLVEKMVIKIPLVTTRILLLLVAMFYLNPLMTLIVIFTFPAGLVILHFWSEQIKKIAQRERNALGAMNREIIESVNIAKISRIFGQTLSQLTSVSSLVKNVTSQSMRLKLIEPTRQLITEVTTGIGVSGVILILVLTNGTSADLIGFFAAMLLVLTGMRQLVNEQLYIQALSVASSRVFNFLNLNPSIVDKPDATDLEVTKGVIEFNNVGFAYSGSGQIIDGLDLKIEGATKIALVGETGSGKSTIISLIMRFWDVDKGSIKIDGQDIRDVTISSLMQSISAVTQDIILLDRSIYENVAFGNPGADNQEVMEAIEQAQLTSLVNRCPEGVDTVIGEKGVKLSGGEAQRLSIARALIKKASIIILDEATSSLDTKTERKIQKIIDTKMENKTIIIIAHRLSTIENVDKVIVLDQGKIVEFGAPSELLAKGKYFASFVKKHSDAG